MLPAMLTNGDLAAIGRLFHAKVEVRFAAQERKIDTLAAGLLHVHELLDVINGRLDEMGGHLKRLEDRADDAALDMAEVKSRLGRMEFRIEGIATIVEHSHETRILALESRAVAG